jgi:long-chain fatty acid transport protein
MKRTLLVVAAALAPLAAQATTGYFQHGYGIKAQGMGGVGIALPQDALAAATNPAGIAWVGDRIDLGATLFMPDRGASITGSGAPGANGTYDGNDTSSFLIPDFGYHRAINPRLTFGLAVYGNGGMNTDYPQGNFNCGAGPANMLCGSGKLGVDLMQLIVAPTASYKLAPHHAVGASLLLGYQRFKADGLQAFDNAPGFPAFTQSPGNVTNRGYDSSTGVGIRIGYYGQLTDRFTVGAAYSPKMHMSKFSKYKGLFADDGSFDFPENYSVGVSFAATPAWTVAADWQRINYGGVPSVGNPSNAAAPLGAPNGPGFGWRDIDVFKVGVAWQMNSRWTLRAGYNHSQNPVRSQDVTFNILAPGVMTQHFTGGFTYALDRESELNAAFMIAPRQSVTGSSMFNGIMGAGAAGNETIRMRQFSVGLGWSRRF